MFANRVSSTLLRTSPLARPGTTSAPTWTRMTLRNKSTSTSSSSTPLKSSAEPAAKSTNSASSSSKPPKAEKEPGFFTMIFQGQSKLTIATVIAGAVVADASVTYLALFHNRKEGVFMNENTFYHRLLAKLGLDLNKVEEVFKPKEE